MNFTWFYSLVSPSQYKIPSHLANGPWEKKWTLFSLLNMESPKVQKVSHWLSKNEQWQECRDPFIHLWISRCGIPSWHITWRKPTPGFSLPSFTAPPVFPDPRAIDIDDQSSHWDLERDPVNAGSRPNTPSGLETEVTQDDFLGEKPPGWLVTCFSQKDFFFPGLLFRDLPRIKA